MNKTEFAILGRMVSNQAGVMIAPSKTGGWYADPYRKVIFYPDTDSYEDADIGLILHEAGHIRFSVFGAGKGLADIDIIKKLDK